MPKSLSQIFVLVAWPYSPKNIVPQVHWLQDQLDNTRTQMGINGFILTTNCCLFVESIWLLQERWPNELLFYPSSEYPTLVCSSPILISLALIASALFLCSSPRWLRSISRTKLPTPCWSTFLALALLPLICPMVPCSVILSLSVRYEPRCKMLLLVPVQSPSCWGRTK